MQDATITFVNGSWIDFKGDPVTPGYNSIIDLTTSEAGWQSSLKEFGLQAEFPPAQNDIARCIRAKSTTSTYVHLKGFEQSGRKRRR